MSENNSAFQKLGYKVLLNESMVLNKAFILYNIEHKTYKFNLSGFMVYDVLVNEKPKELYDLIRDHEDMRGNNKETLTRYELLDLLRNHKLYYEVFKQIINVEKVFINSTMYKPIKKQFIEENGVTYLNLYEYNNDFENVKISINSKFPLIKEFILNLCGQDELFYNKFIEVCAWKLQHPLVMLSQCNFIFQDNGGTGKSEILLDMILNKLFNVKPINQSILEADNNSYMVNANWVVIEEVEGFKDAKKIKSLTGAKTIMINEKYVPIYESINYVNFIIFSNDAKTLQIDETDRRFNVGGGGIRLSPLPTQTWKDTYFKSEENNINYFSKLEKNIDTELKNMYSYLMALPVKRSKVQQLVNTKQRTQLINLGKNSALLLLDEIKSIGLDKVIDLIDYHGKIHDIIKFHEGENYILFKDLYNIYCKFHKDYVGLNTNPIGKNRLIHKFESYSIYKKLFGDCERLYFLDGDARGLKIVKPQVMDETLNKKTITL